MVRLCREGPLEVKWRFRIKEFVEGAYGTLSSPPQRRLPGTLPAGAEVRSWNGMPIERVVDVFVDRHPPRFMTRHNG